VSLAPSSTEEITRLYEQIEAVSRQIETVDDKPL
jgi:hypothetical protein